MTNSKFSLIHDTFKIGYQTITIEYHLLLDGLTYLAMINGDNEGTCRYAEIESHTIKLAAAHQN